MAIVEGHNIGKIFSGDSPDIRQAMDGMVVNWRNHNQMEGRREERKLDFYG
ncbi:hypothetical protein BEST7613_1807 [Synechocystis sp. PCC 6803]|nr:hypothetical protein BEST7613_1807 [Synechocystis sp. PCC 6803] [Bacillus subtilis BEST7613]